MLSKPNAESSGGSSDVTSTSRASRSRMALAYSRDSAVESADRPGFGSRRRLDPARARGSSASRHIRRLVGRGMSLRRHRARASSARRRFPNVSRAPMDARCRACRARGPRLRALVVAGDAVAVDDAARVEGGIRRSRRRRRRALSAAGRQDGPSSRQHPRRCDCERDSSHLTPGADPHSPLTSARLHLISMVYSGTTIRSGCMTVPRWIRCPDQVLLAIFAWFSNDFPPS